MNRLIDIENNALFAAPQLINEWVSKCTDAGAFIKYSV